MKTILAVLGLLIWLPVSAAWAGTGVSTPAAGASMEGQYTTVIQGGVTSIFAADQLIKTGPGFVHTLTCYSDAAATAGTIAIRDAVAAGAGDILWSWGVLAIAYTPVTFILDSKFTIGLYADYTTTADVTCAASYR